MKSKIKPLFEARGVPREEILLAELIREQELTGGHAIMFIDRTVTYLGFVCYCARGAFLVSRGLAVNEHSRDEASLLLGNDAPEVDATTFDVDWLVETGRAFQAAYND